MTLGIGAASDPGLAAMFLVGLFGGAHCLGMCGPLVSVYADRMREEQAASRPRQGDGAVASRQLRQHLLFNLGRTAGYATAGGVLGAVGTVAFASGTAVGLGDSIRGLAGAVAGVFILAMGVRYLRGGAGGAALSIPVLGSAFAGVSSRLLTRVDRWVRGPSIAALGLVHALLPCPILYPAYLYAFATGSPRAGALSLAALGLGTFPALFLAGTAVGAIPTPIRRRLHRVLGGAFLLLGLVLSAKSLRLLGIGVPGLSVGW